MTRLRVLQVLVVSLSLAPACGDGDPKPDDTGTVAVDEDGDGFESDLDCDDSDPGVHPGAEERCNGVDDDGFDAVLVGAFGNDEGGFEAGAAYLFYLADL